MKLREMAEEIVQETMRRLNRNINIMDAHGTIIASGDLSRINQFHEGALEVIRSGKPVTIGVEEDRFNGVLPGINLPIEFQGKVVGVIGITGDPKEVEEFGGLVKMTTEMMIKQSYLSTQSEWEQRMSGMIIEELIHIHPAWEFVEQRMKLLSIELIEPFYTVILEMKEQTIGNQKLLNLVKELFGPKHCLSGFLSVNRIFVLTLGVNQPELHSKLERLSAQLIRLGISANLGVGTKVDHPEKISMSYREAVIALNIEQSQITYYEDIEAKALIYQLDDTLKQEYLNRLFQDPSLKMVATLQAFFSCNRSITDTAKTLYIHRNTLLYRLGRIKEETGYDPHIFVDAVALQIAVWMYESFLR